MKDIIESLNNEGTEFILSSKIRFLALFGTTGEGFGMTILNGLYIRIAQNRYNIKFLFISKRNALIYY
jgi:hypothetical protein